MMDVLKGLFDLTKLPAKFFLLFAITSAIVLFSPDDFLGRLHLIETRNKYGWIIGLIFISTGILSIINMIVWVYNYVRGEIKFIAAKTNLKEVLVHLDPHEKSVLREMFIQGRSSMEMPMDNQTVAGLVDKNVLKINNVLGSSAITSGMRVPMSIGKYALKYLELEHIDLKLQEEMTEEDKEFIANNRPPWIDKWSHWS
ncbi:superinfection exclusion B family protein [Muricauda sp. 2012CJ35-5]|uniref:Superinfection exclusion B family protein n=1 Tax=Flagellimonas spongiicola TaxID=2942208 RepID=A0ABT0PME8_9FLAO|nr:super-infection exclusion protein B [Allomuricauda spongiicola]MCL6272538.1 superinfection exclusion B family protein [Allomuricauda spongiicola]